MSLPRIPSLEPVTEQQKAVTEFPDLFMTLLVMRADASQSNVRAKLKPYNYDAGVISTDSAEKSLTVPDLYKEAARVPVLAQAVGALLEAVIFLSQEETLVNKIETLEQVEDKTEEQETELTTLNMQLGDLRTAYNVTN